jgi:DnaK suppressor protein
MSQVVSTASIESADLARLRALLAEERATLAGHAGAGPAVDDGDGAAPGTGELDSLRYEQGVSAAVASMSRTAVAEIDAALGRIADGTYGACLACAAAIPVERLEAMPAAAYCVSCQQLRE